MAPAAAEPIVPAVPPGYRPPPAVREAPAPAQHRYEPVRSRHAPYDNAVAAAPVSAVPVTTPIVGRVDEGETLPRRVPAVPDVPNFSPLDATEAPAETTQIARMLQHLRRKETPAERHERPAGFDVPAVLAAVREVPGVRDAQVRTSETGAHTLRLDLADGADAGVVSRQVARLLGERMGLAATPQGAPPPVSERPSPPPGVVPQLAGAPVPAAGRATVDRATMDRGGVDRATVDRATMDRATVDRSGADRPGRGNPSEAPEAGIGETYRARRSQPSPTPRTSAPQPSGYDPLSGYPGPQAGPAPAPSRPLSPGARPGPRVVLDHVQVSTFGLEATVEVRLSADGWHTVGLSSGPAVDGYVLRLCAVAAAVAIDDLLRGPEPGTDRGRCFVEQAAVVTLGSCEVAVVVVLLACGGWVEQLAGSALVSGDPRQAVVRATLAAVNRRLEGLLS